MKIVNTGKLYRIYSDDLKVHNSLPPKAFNVRFNKTQGFFLEESLGINTHDERIYGVLTSKVTKVMDSFQRFERNLGIILSGDKGIGKSLFAKLVCQSANKKGLPVIIIDAFKEGVAAFIEEIDQEIVVLFDEFDKTFADNDKNNENNAQASMLTLFDGIASGKKMYIITCNNFRNLNTYLVNRPGRFHYHFRFDYPTSEEIQEYLQNKLNPEYWSQIQKVINFSTRVDLNYDCLRAIAYELENGEDFSIAIKDLNILNLAEQRYNIELYFNNSSITYTSLRTAIDMFRTDRTRIWLEGNTGKIRDVLVSFTPADAVLDPAIGAAILLPEQFVVHIDDEYSEDEDNNNNEKEEQRENLKTLVPKFIKISKTAEESYKYTV